MRLVYVSDQGPGYRRVRRGRRFAYLSPANRPVRDERILRRIRRLAIPPAYTDVWICPQANGHLQATGRDARGRKQYRYHPDWRAQRDATKYDRMLDFSERLPRLRRRVAADLRRPGMPREKVLAGVVRLLEASLIRVGNEEYARLNRSFGLTTLKRRHARVEGSAIRFRFAGKSGQRHEVGLRDRRLAAIVRRCQDLPGQDLFAYVGDDGVAHDISSEDVNEYLREISGIDMTAKDFRTWAGTVLAYRALRALAPVENGRAAKKNVVEAVRLTADQLGNTPAVARKSYVHPAVLEAYLEGTIGGALLEAAEEQHDPPPVATSDEASEVVKLIRARIRAKDGSGRSQRTR